MASDDGFDKEVEREVFAFAEAGDTLIGTILSREPSKQYANQVYKIQKADGGDIVTVFGSQILDSLLAQVEDKKEVKIVYQGEIKTKSGRLARDYKVYVK